MTRKQVTETWDRAFAEAGDQSSYTAIIHAFYRLATLCNQLADRIEQLEAEKATFYMEYRMKTDEQLKAAHVELAKRKAELAALRELMNCYNMGGWTDALAPMERAIKAEAELAALKAELAEANRKIETMKEGIEAITQVAVKAQAQEPVGKIDYDAEMDRHYIPVHPDWEIQTKGKGSSFRIANTKTHERWLVMDKSLHEVLEQMARDINATPPPSAEDAKDAARLDWIAKNFFVSSWNGVVGSGCKTNWRIAGDHRHTTALMTKSTFLDSIDAARGEG